MRERGDHDAEAMPMRWRGKDADADADAMPIRWRGDGIDWHVVT